jgi:hypothetical protein
VELKCEIVKEMSHGSILAYIELGGKREHRPVAMAFNGYESRWLDWGGNRRE